MSNAIRTLVSQSSRILGNAGLDDFIWGHSSARDPEGRGAWLKRSGIGLAEIDPGDVQLVSLTGEVVEGAEVDGGGDRHLEYPIHTEIYRERPDVNGVVHIHPPYAVALAASGIDLRPVSHQATLFTPPTPAKYTATTDLIRNPQLGQDVARTLGNRNAIFLVNHGIVTVGPDLESATVTALLLEEACEQQLRTMGFGEIAHWTEDSESVEKRHRIYSPRAITRVWEQLLRSIDGN